MEIHSDTLTKADLYRLLPDGVDAYVALKGSRKRARKFEVTLFVYEKDTLHRRYGNSGGYGASTDVAATWDEWGIWIDRLYQADPDAIIGWYQSYDHFMQETRRMREICRRFHKPTSLQYRTKTAPWLERVAAC